MLVLSVKPGEALVLGKAGEIKVEVIESVYGRVRLGVTADQSIRVDREEIHEARKVKAQAEALGEVPIWEEIKRACRAKILADHAAGRAAAHALSVPASGPAAGPPEEGAAAAVEVPGAGGAAAAGRPAGSP